MRYWYAVYVNVKHEKKVLKKLLDSNIVAYAPFVKKLRQWSDRKKMVEFPLLNGYVFVHVEDAEKETVLRCPGIFSFIKFGGVDARIKNQEIDILKSIEKSGYDVTMEPASVNVYDKVEITQGHLKGLQGMVVKIQNAEYLQMELESIHKSIKVHVPKHIIKSIN